MDGICDAYRLVPRECPKTLEVKNLRIVNGRQTCAVLSRFPTEAHECFLMLRLIQVEGRNKTEFPGQIAVAKNRQNPIRGRDLFAHHSVQLLLEGQARTLPKPFFYERRERDWNNVKDRLSYRKRFGKRVIRNDEAAKAYVSTMFGDPFKAKHRFYSYIFLSKENNGFYEDVFRPDLGVEDLIVADELYQVVESLVREKRSRYHELAKKSEGMKSATKLSPEEDDELRTLTYLIHGETYLAAVVWYLLDKHIGKKKTIEILSTFDRPLDEEKAARIRRVCDVAANVLVQQLSSDDEFYSRKGLRFNPRNFFAREDSYKLLKATADRWVHGEVILEATK